MKRFLLTSRNDKIICILIDLFALLLLVLITWTKAFSIPVIIVIGLIVVFVLALYTTVVLTSSITIHHNQNILIVKILQKKVISLDKVAKVDILSTGTNKKDTYQLYLYDAFGKEIQTVSLFLMKYNQEVFKAIIQSIEEHL